MKKYIELDDFYYPDEPTIRIINVYQQSPLKHIKLASEALDYIKNVRPIPEKTIILVLAMTAGEFYGPNRNGDAWPERPLRVKNTVITENDILPKHYKTFETNGKVFKHHVNKDPEKSIGDVLKAFYNWKMHRVELLLALDNNKAEDVVEQIQQGKFPAVSMGCKVPYDVCSVCGNRAPNRIAYCEHTKYHMGEFLKNGKRIFVWNPSPTFFDLSIVARPADRLGYMMKKVAEVPEITLSAARGEKIAELQDKAAQLRKLSLIAKIIRGDVTAAKTDDNEISSIANYLKNVVFPLAGKMPPIPDSVLRQMAKFPVNEVVSTLGVLGIILTTPEFIKLLAFKYYPNLQLTAEVLTKIVAVQHHIFDLIREHPELLEEIINQEKEGSVNTSLLEKISFLEPYRSYKHDNLVKFAIFEEFQSNKPLYADPTTGYVPFSSNVITIRDPITGEKYQTTEGAIRQSETLRQRALLHARLPSYFSMGAGMLLRAIPGVGPLIGGGLIGYGISSYSQTGRYLPSQQIQTPYGTIRYKAPEQYRLKQTPYSMETPMKKTSTDHLAAFTMALNYLHYPKAKNYKIATLSGDFNKAMDKFAAFVSGL